MGPSGLRRGEVTGERIEREMHDFRAQVLSCVGLCDPTDCSLPGLCPWDFLGKNTGVGCHFLLQGIFSTQGSNPCLQHLLPCQADFFFTTATPRKPFGASVVQVRASLAAQW